MRRLLTTLFCLSWLSCVVFYYLRFPQSLYVLPLLFFALVLFVMNAIDSQLDTLGLLQQVPLSALLKRRWDWRFMFATRRGLAPMQTTNCAGYLEDAKKTCSDSAGSNQSTQTISNESNDTGLDQLRWDSHTSTIIQSSKTDSEPGAERGPIECSKEQRPSITSASWKKYELVAAVCLATLLYLFPMILLLEIKDTTTRTESEVDHIAVKLTSGLSPAMADRILAKVNSR